MANTRKPGATIQRAPSTKRATDEKRKYLESGYALTIDGERFEVRVADITPRLAAEFRRRFGFGTVQLQAEISTSPDVDVIQAFIWLAKRLKGEQVEPDDIEVDYGAIFDISQNPKGWLDEIDEAPEDDGSPEV